AVSGRGGRMIIERGRRKIPAVVFLFVAASLAGLALRGYVSAQQVAPAKSLPEAVERARGYVKEKFAGQVPGLSVAVGVDGKIVWSEAFGFADLAAKKPATTETLFRIGSVSKPVTAAGLMLLVEQGKLDLDADIHKYVPDFPDKGAIITSRQLAGHLAGIRHYKGDEFLLNKAFPNVRAGLKIFEDDPLLQAPGEKFVYSSYGWNLLSAVMEGASKEEFLAYMQKRVFERLKLARTMPDYAGRDVAQRTQFYERARGGNDGFVIGPTVDNSYKWAGGGFLSTPEDLVRFGSALLRPGFLKSSSLDALFTSQKTKDGKETGYGIGWQISKDAAGHVIYWHTGGSIGGTTVLLLHPESRTVLAMTANLSGAPLRKDDREALAELFSALFPASAPTR
ncbi:MAG TPA: serine hydrolase domain-containing protein, partial [Candidatus Nitrosotenuis sp.]|nr:serine hydrolase domain-containing protein [Candidatus Nitrosotenuis sp.]